MKLVITKTITLVFLLAILSLVTDCKKGSKDDKLSLSRQNYTGNQLRIDGYYYQLMYGKIFGIQFLWRNGVICNFSGNISNFNEAETMINTVKDKIKSMKNSWGVFFISNNDIKIEQLYPSFGGGPHIYSYISTGTILNDTTFQLTKIMRYNGTEEKSVNEIYHFKQYSPKPDSTNSFVP